MEAGDRAVIDRAHLGRLLDALRARGYRVLGPTIRDGAIAYDEVSSVADLPVGWSDQQDAGTYRLVRRDDGAVFGYTVGAHSWKRVLYEPLRRLCTATRREGEVAFEPEPDDPPRYALLGARACDLAAIAVLDRVLLGGAHADPAYRARRAATFVVAVTCGHAGGTCFCVSMGTGPRAASGFDLALTEITGGRHRFVVEVGGARGAEVLGDVPHGPATDDDAREADEIVARTASRMGRALDRDGLRDLLAGNLEHPRWDDVASRCLTCANCTMVCPTCFCTAVEDRTGLGGGRAERWRTWDSCFTTAFSHIHGGSVRPSARARYRQWLTHKLAWWHDQFGTSGCVGCGRCITWCPAAIDITEEVRAIRATAKGAADAHAHD